MGHYFSNKYQSLRNTARASVHQAATNVWSSTRPVVYNFASGCATGASSITAFALADGIRPIDNFLGSSLPLALALAAPVSTYFGVQKWLNRAGQNAKSSLTPNSAQTPSYKTSSFVTGAILSLSAASLLVGAAEWPGDKAQVARQSHHERTALGVRHIEVAQASVKTLLDHVDAVAAIDLPLALDTAQFAALYAWPKSELQRNAVAAWSTLYDRLAASDPNRAIQTQQSTVYMAAFCPPLRECAEMKLKDGLETSMRPGLTANDGSRLSLRL